MKTKHSIRLLAVAVLASTLLLGACGNKKEEAKNDNANKTTQNFFLIKCYILKCNRLHFFLKGL